MPRPVALAAGLGSLCSLLHDREHGIDQSLALLAALEPLSPYEPRIAV